MFAICIWIDDSTVNGSVVSLNKMMLESDPIKPVNPYELKEGDLVKAPCHGFSGLHRCVIAKIGNGGKSWFMLNSYPFHLSCLSV